MERNIINSLVYWKNDIDRKPLILKGARQVGKTWIMKYFGTYYYHNFVYFNFDENEDIKSIFKINKDPFRIINLLSIISNTSIKQNDTLIIFDEIQECPEALNTLKYFHEKANAYHIIAAGSLLGTLLSSPKTYPVGQVDIIKMYPLTFSEFLLASNKDLYNYFNNINIDSQIEEYFHNKLLDMYNEYLIVGGMPECVSSWLKCKDTLQVLNIQKNLLEIYKNDFSKYNGKVNAGRLLMVFNSIPSQLAKDNEKFVYGAVRQGGRARDFEEAIQYLLESGLIYKVNNVSKIEHPLKAFEKIDQFKLFFFDIGLLKCMTGLSNEAIILKGDYQFKGPFTENFVAQQLISDVDKNIFYYSNLNREIDFLIENKTNVIPLEVKAGEKKASQSFKNFLKEKSPKNAFRVSKLNYDKNCNFTNIPLYLISKIDKFIKN